MAKAILGVFVSPHELQNQQQTSQNQTDPKTTVELSLVANQDPVEPVIFDKAVDPSLLDNAQQYIEQQARRPIIEVGNFMIGLLDELRLLPPPDDKKNVTQDEDEDTPKAPTEREAAIMQISKLVHELDSFSDPATGRFKSADFSDKVLDKVGDDVFSDPLVELLHGIIRRRQVKGNRSEAVLMSSQRIAIMGVAKQRGIDIEPPSA